MTIEGIPDGWELDGIRQAEPSEPILDDGGNVAFFGGKTKSRRVFPILKKIEKPKQYRPFANAAEFEPFRDRWFCPKIKRNHLIKTSAYNEHRHWSGEEPDTWEKMFDEYVFDDGTPFGIEVME